MGTSKDSVQRPLEPISADPPGLWRTVALRQRWQDLIYLHWAYEPSDVQALLPRGVFVDTFDGAAWVGLIPFEMRKVRIGSSPVVPWIGRFHEVNVRTYVTDRNGRRAVWFFSLEVPRSAIVPIARSVFSVPYCWAATEHRITGATHRYTTRRRWPVSHGAAPGCEISARVGDRLDPSDETPLDHFLTARWALLAKRGAGPLRYGRVHHARWPLHAVSDVSVDQDLIEAAGLPSPVGPPLARFSPGVDVALAAPERVIGLPPQPSSARVARRQVLS